MAKVGNDGYPSAIIRLKTLIRKLLPETLTINHTL